MLSKLELKLPPGFLLVVFAFAIWMLDWLGYGLTLLSWLPGSVRLSLAALLFLAAALLLVASALQFRRRKTTLDPRIPEQSSALVTDGVYRLSRNPIYVGFTGLLMSEATFLDNGIGVGLVILFAVIVQRLQIHPEEVYLQRQFETDYRDYCARVRRWL